MTEELQSMLTWMMGGSVFGLVVSVWFICMLLWYLYRAFERQRLEQRLLPREKGKAKKTRVLHLWREGKVTTTVVQRGSIQVPLSARINEVRDALGWDAPLSTALMGLAGLSSSALVVTLSLTGRLEVAVGAAVGVIVIAWICVKQKIKKRTELFERQFIDALSLATRSLRAGHPVLGAFKLIVDEMDTPVKTVFADITQQQALGVSLPDAIQTTAAQSTSPDLKLFAASIVIQLRSGGNLADMMERLAHVIRDRIRLNRRARTLTAQTQLSKRILIGVPFAIFIALYYTNSDYLAPLYTTSAGKMLLVVAAVCLLLGRWLMNRIAILRY